MSGRGFIHNARGAMTTGDDVMDDMTQRLYETTDAMVWAEEWCKVAREIEAAGDGRQVIDEGWMVGWFANAMATADMHNRNAMLATKLAVAIEHTQEYLGSDVLPPIEGWSWFDALCEFYGDRFIPADQRPPREPDPDDVPVATPSDG